MDNFSGSSASQGISGITNLWQLLHGADRVLLVQPDENNDIKIQHLVIPVSCIYMLFQSEESVRLFAVFVLHCVSLVLGCVLEIHM